MTDRTFEIGGAALESAEERVRKLMDNIVGSEVPGYKKSEVIVRGFELELDQAEKKLGLVRPQVEDSFINTSPGTLQRTGNKTDLALGEDGYFVISGPWGEGYTRDGRFQVDKFGQLLTVAGNYPVLGQGGPIMVPPGSEVEFSEKGEVQVNGVVADQLMIVKPDSQGELENLNGSIFKKNNPASIFLSIDAPRVIQGYLETSNSEIVEQMMQMIEGERYYNLNTKLINSRDQNLARAMDLGKVQ